MKTKSPLQMSEEELRLALQKTLENTPNDYSKIIEISNQLASFDTENVRFSVDAGVINRLGKELVGRHETAVSELVKNAYDADATEVNLIFIDALKEGGSLHILDNGVGMTRDQLINGFMRLSSSDKIHNPRSPRYNRVRAGRKGIGRFATQRLGDTLTIVTQTKDSKTALKIEINWLRFEIDKDLYSIENRIEEIPKQKVEGTELRIEGLREVWSNATIKRVYRYTSELLQPFPLSKERKKEESARIDPGFRSSYYRDEVSVETKVVDEEEAFLKHALADIEGYVLEDGQGCWALTSKKLDVDQEVFLIGKDNEIPDSKFDYIKGVHFKCYYFIYEPSLLPSQTLRFIRDVANERGGIRLYRNGFRVLPYGEKQNDWLGLDDSTARRVILSSHRNINFFGFVEVTDGSGLLFDETSSREGLFENKAFKELVDFVSRSIITAVQKIAELRGRKVTAGQRNYKREVSPSEKVDSAYQKIKDIFEESRKKTIESQSGTTDENIVFDEFEEAREQEKLEKQAMLNELSMLRILAGLGLAIGEFVHEVKRFLPAFNTDISFLRKAVKENPKVLSRVDRLNDNIKGFTVYTSYFDRAISRNVLRNLEPIEIRDAVNDFIEVIQNDIIRSNITLEKPVFLGFDLYTIPMHPSEWSSILFNLYTNSKKAIKRQKVEGKLKITCGRDNGKIFLAFSDNGDGIDKKIEDQIFNEFFTTSSAAGHSANEIESITSTGLGLKIVKDIVDSYDGDIYVDVPDKDYSTQIRIDIPEKN